MNSDENYQIKEIIGKGSFATVYRAVEKSTGKNVAVKLVDLNYGDVEIENVQGEINALLECKSSNIIKCYQAFLKDSMMWIVMEYMEVGTLSHLIKMRTFKEYEIAVFSKEITLGLNYLHECGIIHRDIKSGNILISSSGAIKLSDFGFSKSFTSTVNKFDTFIGTPLWMAPEIIEESKYNYKADVWSLGITCVEMALGHPPFHDVHMMRALFLIPRRDPPQLPSSSFSTIIQQFVDLCLNKDPNDRPITSILLKHPFLRKARRKSVILPLIEKYLRKKKRMLNEPDHNYQIKNSDLETKTFFKFDLTLKPSSNGNEEKEPTEEDGVILNIEDTITQEMGKRIQKKLGEQKNDVSGSEDGNQSPTWNETNSFIWNKQHTERKSFKKFEDLENDNGNGTIIDSSPWSKTDSFIWDGRSINNPEQPQTEINETDLLKENTDFKNLIQNLEEKIPPSDVIHVRDFADILNQCLNKDINILDSFSLKLVRKLAPKQKIYFCTDL